MADSGFLAVGNTALVLIDIQEKLWRVAYENELLRDNTLKLVQGLQMLGVPILMTEQYPQGLGATLPEIKDLLPDVRPLEKLSFSCCGDRNFLKALESLNRNQLLITGIESHVCVYQTSIGLLNLGYEVQAVTDCISSRTAANREIGLHRIAGAGGKLTSVEMALFELLKVAGGDKFKALSKIVK